MTTAGPPILAQLGPEESLVLTAADGGPALRRRLRGLVQAGHGRVGRERVILPLSAATALLSAAVPIRWTVDARQAVENRRLADARWSSALNRVRELERSGLRGARAALGDLDGVDVLDDHQVRNVAIMTVRDGLGTCVFDEQGTGKTVVVIYAFDALVASGEADRLIVVAPKSMLSEWQHDFARFKGDLYRVAVITGGRRSRAEALHDGADVIVLNFEAAAALEPALRAILRSSQRRPVLVVDESFHIKNRDARRTHAVRRLREWCGRTFVLCGTPAPNSPTDIVGQFDLVDFGATFRGVRIPDDRDAARDVIGQAMRERGVFTRHLKANVLPALPPRQFSRVTVEFEELQAKSYRAALDSLILDLRKLDDRGYARQLRTIFAKRAALLQICSNPTGIVPGYDRVPAKLAALDDILRQAIDEGSEKVVVWSFYRRSLGLIAARYARYNPVRFDGSVSSVADRRAAIRRFQDDDETMLFVANPAAAGAGLTLHRARLAIYESLPNQTAYFLQSIDRLHRRGQTRSVSLVALICANSIESLELDRMEAKAASQRDLLGDPDDRSPSRQALLDELLQARAVLASAPKDD